MCVDEEALQHEPAGPGPFPVALGALLPRRTSRQVHLGERQRRQLPAHSVLDRESAHGDLSAGRAGAAGDRDRPAAMLDMLAYPPGPAQVAGVIRRGRVKLGPGRIANVNRAVGVRSGLNAERHRLTSLSGRVSWSRSPLWSTTTTCPSSIGFDVSSRR